jgi:hypothetical protein
MDENGEPKKLVIEIRDAAEWRASVADITTKILGRLPK